MITVLNSITLVPKFHDNQRVIVRNPRIKRSETWEEGTIRETRSEFQKVGDHTSHTHRGVIIYQVRLDRRGMETRRFPMGNPITVEVEEADLRPLIED